VNDPSARLVLQLVVAGKEREDGGRGGVQGQAPSARLLRGRPAEKKKKKERRTGGGFFWITLLCGISLLPEGRRIAKHPYGKGKRKMRGGDNVFYHLHRRS